MIIASLSIAADHPAYAGHFPGRPVLPGVVLLDAALNALGCAGPAPSRHWELSNAKFLSAVRPGETLTLQHETLPNGSVRFAIHAAERAVANGLLVLSRPSAEQDHGEQG